MITFPIQNFSSLPIFHKNLFAAFSEVYLHIQKHAQYKHHICNEYNKHQEIPALENLATI